MSGLPEILEKRWRGACKAVFREELPGLKDYEPWLSELCVPLEKAKSSLSGKDVYFMPNIYAPGSRRISFDELDFGRKFEPLGINELKNIDSLVRAVQGRILYSGNLVLGNSGQVNASTQISDSFYIDKSALFGDSKYLSNCSLGRLNEDCFGSYGMGESSFCIRCSQTYREKRCFEVWMGQNCSDSFYCYNINNCSDCIFCFHLKNKRHCIGNLELPPEKYREIRDRLVLELVEVLKKKKRLPSLLQIVSKSRLEKPRIKIGMGSPEKQKQEAIGKSAVEREFSKTSEIVLGARLSGLENYKSWLERHVRKVEEGVSAASGEKILVSPWLIGVPEIPPERTVSLEEAWKIGAREKMSLEEAETLALHNAHERLPKLGFFNVDFWQGVNTNMSECSTCIDSSFGHRSSGMVYSKYCAYTFWPRSSEHAFGCDSLFDSSFCINCYHSVRLSRCFELDCCRNCSGCFFCHNCENVHDSMFCFNVKNLKYAIGNCEVGREKYLEARAALQKYISERLEKDKGLGLDIYNLGSAKN